MDNESKVCPMRNLQKDADGVGEPWSMVKEAKRLLENENELVEHDVPSITHTLKRRTE
jgi:hypothetical protein